MSSNSKAYMQQYRAKHRKRITEYDRKWRAANQKRIAEYRGKWRRRNCKRVLAKERAYRAAHRAQQRASGKKWRAEHRTYLAAYDRMRRAARRALINAHKVRCMDCGSRARLEFDHREPTKKLFNIATCMSRSLAVLRREIAKCDVVCKDCHKRRTLARLKRAA